MMKHDRFTIDTKSLGFERVYKAKLDIAFDIPLAIFESDNSVTAAAEWEKQQNEIMKDVLTALDHHARRAYDAYREEKRKKGLIAENLYPTTDLPEN